MNVTPVFCVMLISSLAFFAGAFDKTASANDLGINGRFQIDAFQTYLVVSYVDPNGVGVLMGLRPGDIITTVNGIAPANSDAFAQLLRRDGGKVFLEVQRRTRGGVLYLELTGDLRYQAPSFDRQSPIGWQRPSFPNRQQQSQFPQRREYPMQQLHPMWHSW